MIPRRRLISIGALGGVLGAVGGDDDVAGAPVASALPQQVSEEGLARIAKEIAGLRDELKTERQFTELGPIRDTQKTFLRSNGKFPDYIEVGPDVWFAVHDWHVRWQQPTTIGRDALGRYTIVLNQTTIVMRPDVLGSYIGIPYDSR